MCGRRDPYELLHTCRRICDLYSQRFASNSCLLIATECVYMYVWVYVCVCVCVWVWKRNYCRKSSTYCDMQHMAQHSKVERYWLLWFSALAKDFYIFTYKITFIYICTLYIILAVLMLYPQHFRSLSLPLALLFNACCGILTGAQHPAHNRWQ